MCFGSTAVSWCGFAHWAPLANIPGMMLLFVLTSPAAADQSNHISSRIAFITQASDDVLDHVQFVNNTNETVTFACDALVYLHERTPCPTAFEVPTSVYCLHFYHPATLDSRSGCAWGIACL